MHILNNSYDNIFMLPEFLLQSFIKIGFIITDTGNHNTEFDPINLLVVLFIHVLIIFYFVPRRQEERTGLAIGGYESAFLSDLFVSYLFEKSKYLLNQ